MTNTVSLTDCMFHEQQQIYYLQLHVIVITLTTSLSQPTDGCSNLLKAIISTTRGDIAVGECIRLLEVGVLQGVFRVMVTTSV